MKYAACIFDLDGTLLNTLPDLVFLTNMTLAEWGMPARTEAEINSFVGSGARVLLQRAAVPGTAEEDVDAILARWKELYPEYGHKFTQPYPGIPQALARLKGEGVRLGVLSNKFDAAVRQVIDEHFPGVFDMARGECAEIPRKPDPQGLLWMLGELGVDPAQTAYVGDSGGDMTVALRAGAVPIGVSWGYRSVDDLRTAGAAAIVDDAASLVDLFE